MRSLEQKIKDFAKEQGVSIVGIAGPDSMFEPKNEEYVLLNGKLHPHGKTGNDILLKIFSCPDKTFKMSLRESAFILKNTWRNSDYHYSKRS